MTTFPTCWSEKITNHFDFEHVIYVQKAVTFSFQLWNKIEFSTKICLRESREYESLHVCFEDANLHNLCHFPSSLLPYIRRAFPDSSPSSLRGVDQLTRIIPSKQEAGVSGLSQSICSQVLLEICHTRMNPVFCNSSCPFSTPKAKTEKTGPEKNWKGPFVSCFKSEMHFIF